MAKKLTNLSSAVQFLKTSTPGRIGGLYSSSIKLNPGQSVTVSDEDFAAMRLSSSVQVESMTDAVIDTAEEVRDVVGVGGAGTLLDASDTEALDWHSRNLLDTAGEVALNWENRILRDPNGNECMDWEAREVRDEEEILSIQWRHRRLSNELDQTAQGWSSEDQSGATAARPSGDLAVGYTFFDTTLVKPIWWTGTEWIDASGATV